MAVPVTSQQTAPPKHADRQRAKFQQPAGVACSATSPAHHLQRAIGNRALSSFLKSQSIQPKLSISDPGDESEREADRVANQVMRMADSVSLTAPATGNSSMVQRKCACGATGGKSCQCE